MFSFSSVKLFCLSLLSAISLLCTPVSVFAETSTTPSLAASLISINAGSNIRIAPGATKKVVITFQNTGTATWHNDGANFISLYTYSPKYRISSFADPSWVSSSQPAKLTESVVSPKSAGTLIFTIKAPTSPGSFQETFALASENASWIKGGEFTLSITVSSQSSTSASSHEGSSSETSSATTVTPSASRLAQSANEVVLKAGKSISLAATFKNTGISTWRAASLIAPSGSSFANATWQASTIAKQDVAVPPGGTVSFDFLITAPPQNGLHKAKFALVADNTTVPDAFVDISVTVMNGNNESFTDQTDFSTPTSQLITEPNIRVAVLIVDEETNNEVRIASFESSVEVRDTSNTLLATIAPTTASMRAFYANGLYYYGEKGAERSSALPLRFTPTTPNAVLTIVNFDRRVTRGTSDANNTFRNTLELLYNSSKNRTWLINELPMEFYLRGLAEAGENAPVEMQKSVITAARSYAYYHLVNGSAHGKEGYDIDSARDQVYWGQGQESRTPHLTAAVEATRGTIVSYQDAPAITTYFSRSAGRTLSWKEAWGKDVPYAQSVSVPCDSGRTLLGHGVGMSLSGATCMATAGLSYDNILTYFYSGVQVKKLW